MNGTPGPAGLLQAEIVAMATDVAEVIGELALRIMFQPAAADRRDHHRGGLAAAADDPDRRGQRLYRSVITALPLVIAIGFTASFFVDTTLPLAVCTALGTESSLAAAIMGRPSRNAVYLHSGLARDRHGHPGLQRRWLLRHPLGCRPGRCG